LSSKRIISNTAGRKELYNFCASEEYLAITKDGVPDAELNTLGVGDIFGEFPYNYWRISLNECEYQKN
jgi:hypothetical protein